LKHVLKLKVSVGYAPFYLKKYIKMYAKCITKNSIKKGYLKNNKYFIQNTVLKN